MNYSEETSNRILSAIQNYRSTAESLLIQMNEVFYSCINESMHGQAAEALKQFYLANVLPKLSDELIDTDDASLMNELEHIVWLINKAIIQVDYVMGENIRSVTENEKFEFERIEVDDYVKRTL